MALYWMQETSGVLRPAVAAYLNDEPMSPYQIAILREYLEQWIKDPGWKDTANLHLLRASVGFLKTRQDLNHWLDTAMEDGIDPL